MQNLKNQLPPLEPLVAFECAARRSSFTEAAKELNLSQAAVSQQIRNLEQALGYPLFIRSHRSVRLSRAGIEYRDSISGALKQIAAATQQLKTPATESRISVAVDQSIAAMWLIPRLAGFQQRYPQLTVRVIASDIQQDCLAEDVDIAIIHGDGEWRGFQSELLFPEEVVVVCSPDYLRNQSGTPTIESLAGEILLHLEDSHWNWLDWQTWLALNDVHLPLQHQGLQMNNYPLLIEAAKNGQGFALGWRYLIDDSLAQGTLTSPFDHRVVTNKGYHLVWPARQETAANVALFRDWAKSVLNT